MADVPIVELRETVDRMERRLSGSDEAIVVRLVEAYRSLVPRFESDLPSERDVLLARSGALMLVQALAGN